jgi:hypothetical protein
MFRSGILLSVGFTLIGCGAQPPAQSPATTSPPVTTSSPPAKAASSTATASSASATEPAAVTPVVSDPNVVILDLKENKPGYQLAEDYPTQTLEVTGTVADVLYAQGTDSLITLKTGSVTDMLCLVHESHMWARVGPGQTVTLHGKKEVNLGLADIAWKVVKAGNNPCPVLTPPQLAGEFTDAPSESHSKYNLHAFYLTGKAVEIEPWQTHHFLVKLQTDSDWQIHLQIDTTNETLMKSVKAGQPIAALCRYDNGFFQADSKLIELTATPILVPFPIPGVTYAKSLPSQAERDADVAANMRQASPAIKTEISELLMHSDDAALKQYAGKIAEVTGVIREFEFEDGHPVIRLIDGSGMDMSAQVVLADEGPWNQYVPRQTVTVRGLFPESLYSVKLIDAVVLKGTPLAVKTPRLTASELVKAATGTEYESDVIVSGKVIERKPDDSTDATIVELDGGDGFTVRVLLASEAHANRVKSRTQVKGKTVRLLARASGIDVPEKLMVLMNGWVLNEE